MVCNCKNYNERKFAVRHSNFSRENHNFLSIFFKKKSCFTNELMSGKSLVMPLVDNPKVLQAAGPHSMLCR